MTFDEAPSFQDLAALSPINVRKRPVQVGAMHWPGTPQNATSVIDWILLSGGTARYHSPLFDADGIPVEPEKLRIDTLEGTMSAYPGYWVIQGVNGEFYAVEPSIFTQTYDFI